MPAKAKITSDQVAVVFKDSNGNVSETARILKIHRRSVMRHLRKLGLGKKPVARGSKHGIQTVKMVLPPAGTVHRYIVTSAQNNTRVHDGVWENIMALAGRFCSSSPWPFTAAISARASAS